MISKIKHFGYFFLFIIFSVIGTVLFSTCGVNEEEEKPTIVDCNTIKYKGETLSNIGCRQGVTSMTIQREGWPVFYIQCSITSGCIASVSL